MREVPEYASAERALLSFGTVTLSASWSLAAPPSAHPAHQPQPRKDSPAAAKLGHLRARLPPPATGISTPLLATPLGPRARNNGMLSPDYSQTPPQVSGRMNTIPGLRAWPVLLCEPRRSRLLLPAKHVRSRWGRGLQQNLGEFYHQNWRQSRVSELRAIAVTQYGYGSTFHRSHTLPSLNISNR